MDGAEKAAKEEGELTKLPPKSDPSSVLAIAKKLGSKSLAWLGVYLLGYYGFSVGWMVTPLLLSVLRDQWKKEKRNRLAAAREAALTNEQAMLEARMGAEELPSWVFFPDRDRAEWLNNILKQLWPYVNEYVRDMLFNTVEPLVEETLKQYKLNPFKFDKDKVFLGQVPPRITGIKVYDENTSRKEIILDMDIVFASDMVVEFKVKGIGARVSDVSLRGMLRLVLKPLVSRIPLVGGVQAYFLKAPEIDYNLGGVGKVVEIPGLNKIVEGIIMEQIKSFIVLPNKFSMPLIDDVLKKTLKCPDSAGVLRVKLLRARDLVDKDGLGSGKSDPYAILTVGAHTHRAPTITDNLNPEWNLEYDFPIEVVQGQQLVIELYDDDDRRDDEFLGRAKVPSSLVAQRGNIEGYWVDLVDCDQGAVQVSLSWLPATPDPAAVRDAAKRARQDDPSAKEGSTNVNLCLVHLYLDSASNLTDPRDPSYMASPVIQLVNGHEVQRTWPKYYTNDPVIEQGFVMLIRSPYTDEIRINVLDKNASSKKKEVIGTTSLRVWSLVEQPGMEFPLQPFILKGSSPAAEVTLSVSLRGLLPPDVSSAGKPVLPGSADSVGAETSPRRPSLARDLETPLASDKLAFDSAVQAGRLRVTLHRAEDLVKKDLNGKADPYVVVTYQDQRYQTGVCKKTLEPSWEHEVYINVLEGGDNQVKIEIFDRDKLGSDETMGWSTVDVRRVSRQGELVQEWDQLLGAKRGRLLWSMAFFPEEDVKLTASIPEPSPAPGPNIEVVPVEDLVVEPEGVAETIEEEKEKVEDVEEPKEVEQEEEEESKEPLPPAPAAEGSPSGVLRRRTVAGRGRVRLNLLYDEDKEELKVFVHEAAGLPGGDLPDPPDPQVKIYLMPGKKKKKKTDVVKDSVEPMFNEEFDFSIDYSALPKHSLKVCVVDRKGVFSKSPVLGTTTISLDNPGLKRGLADWFPLEEDEDDSD